LISGLATECRQNDFNNGTTGKRKNKNKEMKKT